MKPRRAFGKVVRRAARTLWPNQRIRWTREGVGYLFVWLGLIGFGLYQQINLVLLVSGLAAGPLAASIFVSAAMLHRLKVTRRAPSHVFSGDPLTLDYTLENTRSWTAALAMSLHDPLSPIDRSISGVNGLSPRLFFARVPGRDRCRLRWQGPSPTRGRYRFQAIDLSTRAPFGLLERHVTISDTQSLVVYPRVGQLSRRWHLRHREATEAKRGQRHDRTLQQQEYHGLRDYRPGDSPRLIHWRTSARVGRPMIKEFEQQHDQDLAILVDPWLPRSKVTADRREALEAAIRFAATVCLETCRHQGRRLLLGWTGPTPSVRQGPASIKLLHELLEQLAVMRPSAEGQLWALFDAIPPATLRESLLIIVSTRPINLVEESERSARLSGAGGRSLASRVLLLNAAEGDLDDLIQFGQGPTALAAPSRPLTESALPAGAKPQVSPRFDLVDPGFSESAGAVGVEARR